jgi:hypothetical protein
MPMDITEFLRNRNADLPAIVANAQKSVGLDRTDILLAVGSLAEGLGNSKSDLDLLLITPREADVLPSREVALVVGKCLSDIQVLPLLKLEEILARFDAWAALPWDITHAANFTLDDRRLLHRLLHCSVIFEGENSRFTALKPAQDELARLKLQVARHMSRTIQVDMAGNREAGDYSSLVFAAQDLLGHAVDALAAGHHLTNPTAKWRSRILECLPVNWERALGTRPTGLSAAQLFWYLHRAPEQPDRGLALEHAFRIATFARAVFAWAERRLLGRTAEAEDPIAWPRVERKPQDTPLPYLDLDVDFSERDGQVSIGRLNEFDDPLDLSLREFEITLLFDGLTTAREAEIAVCGDYSDEAEQRLVDGVISRVARAGLFHSVRIGLIA